MSFSFLIETKIYSQKLKSKALKGFQALASPKVTEQDYVTNGTKKSYKPCPITITGIDAIKQGVARFPMLE
ncbi:MAG: hypothetical protein V7K26_16000 [Nostoc sp.]|uniref:hypothetical protein n=1 Tax=Nostoc sp. TaxID=1180 RepID=UPI002FF28578